MMLRFFLQRAFLLLPSLAVVLVFGVLSCRAQSQSQAQVTTVAPKLTDSRIDDALNDHYVFINRSVRTRNQLVVFLPGTGGEPRNYRAFPTVAANLGFHAVGLMYPNEIAVNGRCGGMNNDLNCAGDVRGEYLDGIDRTPMVAVSRANTIENRLVKLLQYLHRQNPQDNWAQFIERNANGDSVPRWSSIVVAGHSQGGGYAGYIGVVRRVARSIMFCALDYNVDRRSLSAWVTGAKATPLADFFAMGHERDELVNYATLSGPMWSAFGIPAAGAVVNVDAVKPPYPQTRSFSTSLASAPLGVLVTIGPLHNTPVVDVNVPLDGGGYVYQPVWEYMLTAPPLVTSVNAIRAELTVQVFPNPASHFVSVSGLDGANELTLTNILGEVVMARNTIQSPATFDISSLPTGVYILRTTANHFIHTQPVQVFR
jgi:hypothetical protein